MSPRFPTTPEAPPPEEGEEILLAIEAGRATGGDAKVALLNRVRAALRGAADLPGLLGAIVETVRTSLAVRPERVRVELEGGAGGASETAGFDERGGAAGDVPISATVRARVVGKRESLLVADAGAAFAAAGSVRRLKIGCLLAVPMLGADGVLGGIFAYHAGDREPFRRGDLELVTALGGLLAYEVEARRLRDALARENEDLRLSAAATDLVLGAAPRSRAMWAAAEKAGASGLDVLLVGESGTGKERLAQRIHDASARAKGPLVAVDCGALPTDLVESELFGHVRGAFTGATRDRAGRFAEADGGTLFLDEVSNLPLALQPKLLRALESRRITPVGGDGPRAVDLRVVAATNVSLPERVAEGAFRADLYYRLAVLVVELPPLRERLDDLPLLVDAFLRAIPGRSRRFERAALEALARHPWPGNLRELRNVVWRSATLCEGDAIGVGDLPAEVRNPAPPAAAGGPPIAGGAGFPTLAVSERLAIENAMRAAGGNKSRAAALLDISRDTLYRKLGEAPDDDPGQRPPARGAAS